MSKTIVQEYGPIYGEPVNGTVQGRPNGSIYVPTSNTIVLSVDSVLLKNSITYGQYRVRFCDESGTNVNYDVVAQSQDVASNIAMVLASDDQLSDILDSYNFGAGRFNQAAVVNIVADYQLDPDDTYYVAAVLMNNGVPVATSEVIECTVWVNS